MEEGYKDSIIPELSEMSSPLNRMTVFQKRYRKEIADTENSQKERKRRVKFAESFSILQSMVPPLVSNPKASRGKILEETIDYIKILEKEKQRLENMKKKSLTQNQTEASSSSVKSVMKHGLLSKIFEVFDDYLDDDDEILFATTCVDDHGVLTLMAKFNHPGTVTNGDIIIEKMKQQIQSLE